MLESKQSAVRDSLLLLHGGGLNSTMWRPQIMALKNRFSILAPDLLAHGTQQGKMFRLEGAISQVAEGIAATSSRKVVTVGLSLGGYLAIAHAATHPHQVRGIIISGCCVQYLGLMGFLARLNAFTLNFVSPRGFCRLQKKILRRHLSKTIVDRLADSGFSLNGAKESLLELVNKDFIAMLDKVECPVLIVNGQRDKLNRKYAPKLLAAAKQGAATVIRDSGHLCSLEQADVFSCIVSDFAEKVCVK